MLNVDPSGSIQQDFHRRQDTLKQAEKLEQVPIVAVCGTVNSGKSTIVAGMLSEAGSSRVLVGELDSEGTHRFVFWLPKSWRENGLGDVVAEMIRTVTGTHSEELADDPDKAALQYNSAHNRSHEFNIPLIAYDPCLDRNDMAFLDCPDIQRSLDDDTEEPTAHLRLKRLGSIAPMCSAFVVVASMQQKGTEIMGEVFDAITSSASEAPLYFVLNMTKTDDVETYLPEATGVLNKWGVASMIRRCFLSPTIHEETGSSRIKPVITSMDPERTRLDTLTTELDPAELQRRHRLSCTNNLKDLLDDLATQVRKRYKEDLMLIHEAQKRVCAFVSQKLIDANGNPRALEFTEAASQMAESIQRTAPRSIRMAQAPGKWLRKIKWKWRDGTKKELEGYARIHRSDFSQFLLGSRFLHPEVTEQQLDILWQKAFDATIAHGKKTKIDPDELDEMTKQMWNELPFRQKIVLFKNLVIATSAIAFAGVLLPFDGGASIILLAKANLVLGGAEILGILVGGPMLATLLSRKEASDIVAKFEQECARPQIDALYAALMDGLGIPREVDGLPKLRSRGEVCHELKPSDISPLPDQIGVLDHPLICLDEEAWSEMITTLSSWIV